MSGRNVQGVAAIAAAFSEARQQGRAALITYLMAGYPTPAATAELVAALQAGGADLLELGVPFSDPVADGPVIQRAGQLALEAGMTPPRCLQQVAALRETGTSLPIVLMGYYNPILSYGLAAYARACRQAGIDGLIVPDLPLEEADELRAACEQQDLACIQLVAPTSDETRVAQLARATTGFLYVVSRMGTTGAGRSPEEDIERRLAVIRRHAHTPVAVGFGISRPEQALALAPLVDGIVVGSAIVERAAKGAGALQALVGDLSMALAR